MTISKKGLVSLVGGVFLASSLAAMTAFAAESGSELIVRYHPSQKSLSTHIAFSGSKSAEVLNAEQGVVKLRFNSSEEAQAARARLEANGEIANVASNFLYKPAITYRWKTVENSSFLHPALRFPGTGDTPVNVNASTLPSVNPAPTSVVTGRDPLAANDWAIKAIRMPSQELLDTSLANRAPITAAVIDTGIDYNHEDLSGALYRDPANAQVVGYDFAHNVDKPYDVVHFDVAGCLADLACSMGLDQGKFLSNPGHGTHCAGHVGAVANNSIGIRGIGAGARVMGLKFFYDFGDDNAGQGDDAAAIKAIDYAIQHGVKVISASWGGREKPADAEGSELKNALIRAQQAGVLVVIAAGNDSINQDGDDQPDYPAHYALDNLIVVAAVDQNDKLADFSNYGGTTVHIGAPGVKILSTTVGNHYDDVVTKFTDQQGQQHELDWDGTSMATPIVAGATALVWSKFPNENYHQIRARILNSARKVAGLTGKVTTGGVLNVSGALGL